LSFFSRKHSNDLLATFNQSIIVLFENEKEGMIFKTHTHTILKWKKSKRNERKKEKQSKRKGGEIKFKAENREKQRKES